MRHTERHDHSDEYSRVLFEQTSEALAFVDQDAVIQSINGSAVSLFSVRRDECIGHSVDAMGSPELSSAVRRAATEPGYETQLHLAITDRRLTVDVSALDEGVLRGVTIAARDETALSEQRERTEAILAGAGDGLIVFDEDGVVTFVNPAATELLGERLKDAVGTHAPLASLLGIDDVDAPGPDGVVEAEISEPSHLVVEVRTNRIFDPGGRALGSVATLHDVTAAREIAIMKNEFVSMVSHELRTPLTSIKGYVDLIVDGEAGEINETQLEFLQIVQENSDRLVSLINELLDISRIESGRVHLRIEPLDPVDVVNGVMDTFRTYAEQSGIVLTSDVADGLPRIAADGDRVGQVLMNLTSNAIKYSPGGGSVALRAACVDGFIDFCVADSGIGISPEDQSQLFTKFFRVDSSLTREIGGTGLGLSICKSVVELHGGTVWVESTLGEGSTFGFTIPVAPAELIRIPAVEGPVGTCGGTVLVIDQDPEIANLIGTYLVSRGYCVLKAHSAREALAAAQRMKPSLITLDVMLDDQDGFELLQHLKEDPATADVPIVVLSIVTDEGKSLRLGAADYLEKPIDKSRLLNLVDNLVGAKTSPVVLVVDDDRHIADSLARTLKARGFAVAQAYDGSEAMEAIHTSPPDLILLDLKMPVMDGYEVIQAVKGAESTRHIPIVVMTAHRIDHEKTDILKLAAEHVSKPFEPETLASRVAEVLDAERALR